MITADVIIVGGGPGGSSCAWQLQRRGIDCIVLDRQVFPRTKLCAGWITPDVVEDLEIDIEHYPHRFLSFDNLRIHAWNWSFKLKTVQHSIRRYEFDDWLLKRSGVPVHTHYVKDIRKENGYYVIDGDYRCKHLVGAGGTKCPVYRTFFREANPRTKELQVVTLEQEFPYDWRDGNCHLWFFNKGLPGYSWYVPKGNGYVNLGTGGIASKLKQRGDDIKNHWELFIQQLDKESLVKDYSYEPSGYGYYVRGEVDVIHLDNAFIVGDAVGLATRDMCEGIGPAVKSGILAAEAISQGHQYSLNTVIRYSIESRLAKKLLEYMFIKRKQAGRRPLPQGA